MNREEFLQKLEETLTGQVPPQVVRENLEYYGSYIREERRKGRSEAEVMDELGDPRLIARTIIDTTPGGGTEEFEEYRSGFGGFGGNTGSSDEEHAGTGPMGNFRVYDMSKWYSKVLAVIILVGIITLIIAIISGILSLLIPILPTLIVIAIIMRLVRGF